jgi:hypothetical protein
MPAPPIATYALPSGVFHTRITFVQSLLRSYLNLSALIVHRAPALRLFAFHSVHAHYLKNQTFYDGSIS